MELSDLIDAVLDQTNNNKLTLLFQRDAKGNTQVVIRDSLSDIGYSTANNTSDALKDMQEQMQSFVDEQ